MKKTLALIISSVLGVSSLCIPSSVSAESKGGLVILGDSISSGSGLDTATEYNYGQICADYLGCDVSNFAKDGDDTDNLINLIKTDSNVKESISSADTIVISIGSNDIMHFISKEIITFAAGKGYLNKGYTTADIPEKPKASDIYTLIKLTDENGKYEDDCFMKYLINNKLNAALLLSRISANLRLTSGTYKGYIPNTIIPNIKNICDSVYEINSDAQVIVQTAYQPIQFTEKYYNDRFGTGGQYESMSAAFDMIRTTFVEIMEVMHDELLKVDNIDIADVYYEFTSLENISDSKKNSSQGNAHYFTNIQASGDKRDIHPNQKGHIAIAAAVLEQIGELHDTSDSVLLRKLYENLEDKANYPEIALETYNLVAGKYIEEKPPVNEYKLGDVNNDEKIDSRDATLQLQQYASSSLTDKDFLDKTQLLAANVNKDDVVDARDATIILRYYAYKALNGTLTLEEFIESNI